MATPTAIEAAIYAWAAVASGAALGAYWANQNAPMAVKPCITLLLTGDTPQGMGAGAENVQRQVGHPGIVKVAQHARFSLSVNAWSNDVLGDNTARRILERVQASLADPSVQTAFIVAGFKVIPNNDSVNDLSAMLETRGESRAQFDVEFSKVTARTQDRGTIETVHATVTITNGAGKSLPAITT